ncbi:AAA family ATPase [Candidatus Woesearchaeota archaeon]|nr:AAA family ATPase [Candidatus Woesearchaeota archaeon]
MFIGLTGTFASGKGEIASYLKKNHSFSYFSLSDELRSFMHQQGIPLSRENMQKYGRQLRQKEGRAALAERILPKLTSLHHAVIDSIRLPEEAEALRKNLKPFYLISVDAPITLRFERAKLRKRIDDNLTLPEFAHLESLEMEGDDLNIKAVMDKADFRVINDHKLAELHKQVRLILAAAGKDK